MNLLVILKNVANYVLNWVFQGLFDVNMVETTIKLVLEVGLVVLSVSLLLRGELLQGIALSHTIIWIFTTNVWSIYDVNNKKLVESKEGIPVKYIGCISRLKDIINRSSTITGAAIYGSIAQGEAHADSDIDIKLIRKPGIGNILPAYFLLFFIRFWGNVKKYPIDARVLEDITTYELKPREQPISIVDSSGTLKENYGEDLRDIQVILNE